MKMINNVVAKVKANKIMRIVHDYQTHIEDLIDQRNEWRIIAISPTSDAYTKEIAIQNVINITNEITDLVAKRTKVLESSL